ncbi:unnamed protein product [Protopolystoma xenopodis]|uniref:Uncharacterized protein n=1 Tax=Protopolystoma xenopodis TaxID=117903 RepID=A0A3S5AJ27_9PLAT|nr:unnamed protein product [Protopolystoma xenopodis]
MCDAACNSANATGLLTIAVARSVSFKQTPHEANECPLQGVEPQFPTITPYRQTLFAFSDLPVWPAPEVGSDGNDCSCQVHQLRQHCRNTSLPKCLYLSAPSGRANAIVFQFGANLWTSRSDLHQQHYLTSASLTLPSESSSAASSLLYSNHMQFVLPNALVTRTAPTVSGEAGIPARTPLNHDQTPSCPKFIAHM